MKLKYHQKTMDLLGIEPVIEENPEVIGWKQLAKDNDISLPESFLEFWSIKGIANIFYGCTNNISLINTILEYDYESIYEGEYNGNIIISIAFDGYSDTWDTLMPLDGSDDPVIYNSSQYIKIDGKEIYLDYNKSFSDYIYCTIFDEQYGYKYMEENYEGFTWEKWSEDFSQGIYTEHINSDFINKLNNKYIQEPSSEIIGYPYHKDKQKLRYSIENSNKRIFAFPHCTDMDKNIYSSFLFTAKTLQELNQIKEELTNFFIENKINLSNPKLLGRFVNEPNKK